MTTVVKTSVLVLEAELKLSIICFTQTLSFFHRLYRAMVNFFDQRKKVTLKWLGSCERKERQVKADVKELKDSKNEYIKVKVTLESA